MNSIEKDPELWEIAKKRANFKRHLLTYIILNIFFWVLWYFNGQEQHKGEMMPWPAWATLGWGVGLVFNYIGAYMSFGESQEEKEYQKLSNKNK